MKRTLYVLAALLLLSPCLAGADADLQINTPALAQIRNTMHDYFHQLKPHLMSGAVGLTRDGLLAVRDAAAIPLDERQAVGALVAEDNQLRHALYREIARANGHPEWEGEIQATFAQRWIERARPGWWYQDANGRWNQK
jgi:uncharacterized protein YdbL (DUF1318 family)